jgi:hypothetical protein
MGYGCSVDSFRWTVWAQPLTLHQRGYDGARVEYTNSANQNASTYAGAVNQANRETGDRMAAISIQQGKEAAGAAYAAAGVSISGTKVSVRVEQSGCEG